MMAVLVESAVGRMSAVKLLDAGRSHGLAALISHWPHSSSGGGAACIVRRRASLVLAVVITGNHANTFQSATKARLHLGPNEHWRSRFHIALR